ncbi:ankyrin repeat domain-containing protein 50 [Microdochium nivale]|nr:ankyrin repeat domain-containing protein 50 [Microdochium nivale]
MAEALGLTASVIAVVDLSAKVTKLCYTYSREVIGARDDITRVQEKIVNLEALLQRLHDAILTSHATRAIDGHLKTVLQRSRQRLGELEATMKPNTSRLMMSRVGVRALKWPLKSKEVDKIILDITQDETLILAFLQADQSRTLGDVRASQLLKQLPVVKQAAFDSFDEGRNAKCLANTRVQILAQINTWFDSDSSKSVYWLNGRAGTGKSTIARTIADQAKTKGALGATFFFKRGEGDRSGAAKLMTTLAWQLAQQDPALASKIREVIENDEDITTRTLRQQFEGLILGPAQSVPSRATAVSRLVVIDALDECDHTNDVEIIIHLFSHLPLGTTGTPLKLLVTSRPELPIRLGFKRIDGKYDELILHEIQEATIESDIRAYLQAELYTIKKDFNSMITSPDLRLADGWPEDEAVSKLTSLAVPLFIFAATMVRFLSDTRCGSPQKKYQMILNSQVLVSESKLAAAYLPVLNHLLDDQSPRMREHALRRFHSVVGPIILLYNPLSLSSLSELLSDECEKDEIVGTLDQLHSVLDVPRANTAVIRTYHLSFRDFLLDSSLSGPSSFWINAKEVHSTLAKSCIKVMNGFLKRDMCELRAPGAAHTSISQQRLDACIPQEVQYACRFWTSHAQEAGKDLAKNDEMESFLLVHFLHWVEAMALLRRARETIQAVMALKALTLAESSLGRFLIDAHRFLLNFMPAISIAPLQLYSSALAFTPLESIVRNTFERHVPKSGFRIKASIDSHWGPCLQTLESPGLRAEPTVAMAFSRDNNLVAVQRKQSLTLWNTVTGALLHFIEHEFVQWWIPSIVFSPDSRLVGLASSNMLTLWSASTGHKFHTIVIDEGQCMKCGVFSDDGRYLACLFSVSRMRKDLAKPFNLGIWVKSDDGYELWHTTLLGQFKGFTTPRWITFQSDGHTIIIGFADQTVKTYAIDGLRPPLLIGRPSLEPQFSSAVTVSGAACKLIAMIMKSGDIELWSPESNCLVRNVTLPDKLLGETIAALSHDCRLVATHDETENVLRIRDTKTGSLVHNHTFTPWNDPTLLAFSYDGQRLARIGMDDLVQIWSLDSQVGRSISKNAATLNESYISRASVADVVLLSGPTTCKLWTDSGRRRCPGWLHGSSPKYVLISPDGTKIAVYTRGGNIQVRDSLSAKVLADIPLQERFTPLIAWSNTGRRLVVLQDTSVQIHDSSTGILIRSKIATSADEHRWNLVFSGNAKLIGFLQTSGFLIVSAASGNLISMHFQLPKPTRYLRSLVFAPNAIYLVTSEWDENGPSFIRIWSTRDAALLGSWPIQCETFITSINVAKQLLTTSHGLLQLHGPEYASIDFVAPPRRLGEEHSISWHGIRLSLDNSWITLDGESVLWLPADYRPDGAKLRRSPTVTCGDGVWIFTKQNGLVIIRCETDRLREMMRLDSEKKS